MKSGHGKKTIIALTLMVIMAGPLLAAPSGLPDPSGVAAPPHAPHFAMIPGIRGYSNAAAPSFTIKDYGAPPAGAYGTAYAYAFNNTGQIVGTAVAKTSNTQHCIVYNEEGSGKYSDLIGASSPLDCTPQGMSSETNSGTFQIVGRLSSTYIEPYAFYSKIANTGTSLNVSATNVSSELTGVNQGGQAVGDAYYNPPGGFFSNDPLFTSTGKGIVVAQPSCATYATSCVGNIFTSVFSNYASCPFGGCDINDEGTVLASGGGYLIIFPFSSPTRTDSIIQCFNSTDECVYGALINNKNQVVYDELTYSTGEAATFFYSIGTGKTTPIRFLPKSTCTQEFPLSLSNTGVVFGDTYGCSNPNDDIYFVWSETKGTQNLSALVPASSKYSAIYPIAMNDVGQVLVDLVLTNGEYHWGILDPTSGAMHLNHRLH